MFGQPLVTGVLVPAIVAGVILLVTRMPWRTRGSRRRSAGIALALAFVAAYFGIRGTPPSPFGDRILGSQQWRLFLTPLVALAAAGLLRIKFEPLRWLGVFVVLAVAMRAVLAAQFRNYWDFNTGWMWVAIYALAATVAAASFSFHCRRPGVGRPILFTLFFSAIAVALLFGKSASGGQLGGAIAAALGGASVVAAMRRDDSVLDGAGVILAFLAGACLLEGYYFAEVPQWGALVLAAVPLVLTLAELPPLARGTGTVLTPLQWILVIVPSAVALWMTWSANPSTASEYPY